MLSSSSDSLLQWIKTSPGIPYFITEDGNDWTPIGQNDAITWPELSGLFGQKDFRRAEKYFSMLSEHGVTCMRLMLEYCQTENRYFEKPAGKFQPNMIRLWDDIFALCEKYSIRVLLTPFDTFWMKRRWASHPYNKINGGPCAKRSQLLVCADTRDAIKNRLAFVTERWGLGGALFAWDLWNEIHPANASNEVECLSEFIDDIGRFLSDKERSLFGQTHLQTVSFFGTTILNDHRIAGYAFRHASLDFASIHFYENKAIDRPKNIVEAAIATGMLTSNAIAETEDGRPFFDSEHGPINIYKSGRRMLEESFDDEYFRCMQWAHLASGGAGGGMRWPYRHPHVLTEGMRKAQRSLAVFCSLVSWNMFARKNWNDHIKVSDSDFIPFGCGNNKQAIAWMLRKRGKQKKGRQEDSVTTKQLMITLPSMNEGKYSIIFFDTITGVVINTITREHKGNEVFIIHLPDVANDIALAIQKL